jgi:hypothetical protein
MNSVGAELSQGHFTVIESKCSKSFGDAYVILASNSVYVRLVRDRSRVFIEVSNGEWGPWWDLELVVAAASDDRPHEVAVLDRTAEHQLARLRETLGLVVAYVVGQPKPSFDRKIVGLKKASTL